MKKTTKMLPIALVPFLLTSCGQTIKYEEHLPDYVFDMDYRQNFNILQLTDIHWNINSSTYESKQYLDKVFKEADRHIKEDIDSTNPNAKIDLVELTGDMFMLSNTFHVRSFINYMEKKAEEYGFKYTSIWGNHDRHGMYHPNWLAEQFAKAPHCLYRELNDNLYGRSNFVINLNNGGATKWQIANLDSGASFSESPASPFRDYDYIRKDQTQWWLAEHKAGVPAIAYYHIPQDENLKMWNEVQADPTSHKNAFFKLEDFADNGNEKYASDFIDEGIKNDLKGAFMGHAHNVDWTVEMEDGGNKLILGLGVKTGIELYYAHIDVNSNDDATKQGLKSLADRGCVMDKNFDLIGASLVTITDDPNTIEGKFDLEHLYLNERNTAKGYDEWWVRF